MSKEATREYVVHTRIRYGAMTRKRAKGRVLDEFCAAGAPPFRTINSAQIRSGI